MRMLARTSLVVLALALAAPTAIFAQTCPTGYTFTSLPGGGFECTPDASAPEISTSASTEGLVLLVGAALIFRGRKRVQANA
jgi:hypothetical protein